MTDRAVLARLGLHRATVRDMGAGHLEDVRKLVAEAQRELDGVLAVLAYEEVDLVRAMESLRAARNLTSSACAHLGCAAL